MTQRLCAYCKKEFAPYRPAQIYCSPNCQSVAYQQANPEKVKSWRAKGAEKARQRTAEWRKKHPERSNRASAEWRKANPDRARTSVVNWHKANSEKRKEHRAKWRAGHSQEIKAKKAQWFKANPDKGVTYSHRRRAKKAANGGIFTTSEWQDLKIYYGYQCLCCGEVEPNIKLTVDHVVPIERGGSNDITNIQPLCRTCNLKKGTQTIDYRPK